MPDPLKKSKKILILSGSFYPTISPRALRTTELARELARKGHRVKVVFPARGYDYSDFEKENNLEIEDIGPLKWKPVKIKGGRFESLARRAISRSLQLLIEWPALELMFKVSRYLRYESGYDMLISVAVPYPIHWGVARSRRRKRPIAGCWVADCGDPYMGDTTDSFRKLFYFKYVEKFFGRRADYITIPIEAARSAYYPEFHHKIKVIPQGFRLDEIGLPEYKKKHEYPVFAYAGTFFPGQHDPRPLLEFLSEYDRQFKWIIYTRQNSMVEPFKKRLGDKLEIREYIPREELLRVLATMDFLINFAYDKPTQLPIKLIDYAIIGRPVYNIRRNQDFSVLKEFMNGDYSRRLELDPPEKYDIRSVADQFLQLQNSGP